MKRIIPYNKFNEDAMAGGGTAGMGAVSNAGVSSVPGDVSGSTSGSGDVSFPMNVDGKNIVYTNEPAGLRKVTKDSSKPKKKKKKKKEDSPKDINSYNKDKESINKITKVDDFK